MIAALRKVWSDWRAAQSTVALVIMVSGLLAFFAVQGLVQPHLNLETAIDRQIPFLPASMLVYVLFFPFVVLLAGCVPLGRFREFLVTASLAYCGALVCFFLLPEAVPRPDVSALDSAFWREQYGRIWAMDEPTNGFPSLHVAITCLACRMCRSLRQAKAIALLGVLICLSTMTTKQHTLADVLGGAALAYVSVLAVRRSTRMTEAFANP